MTKKQQQSQIQLELNSTFAIHKKGHCRNCLRIAKMHAARLTALFDAVAN